MKKSSFALATAFVLALALTGCSASRESNTARPSHSVTGSDSGVYETNNGNDALQGGGAGGTNDRNNDGLPDSTAGVGQAQDDIDRDADDVIRDADDAVRDAGDAIGDVGDAIGDAVDDAGQAMR